MRCYLHIPGFYIEYDSIADAKANFKREAEDLARFGQALTATLHIAPRFGQITNTLATPLNLGLKEG